MHRLQSPIVAALAAVFASVIGVSSALAASPAGYQMPQCTAGADFICAANGWRLTFSGGARYNALDWAWAVNAQQLNRPACGAIVVFAPWQASPLGHVAVVTDWTATTVTVEHSNWQGGALSRKFDGVWTRTTVFTKDPQNPWRLRTPGGTWLNVSAFLFPLGVCPAR